MSSESDQMSPATTDGLAGKKVSRRDFLKIGALTGAALGVGGGLTGALAACGSDSGSTADGGSGGGREIKVGFVTPLTGPLASFGIPDAWCVKQWEAAVAGGLECGDGQKHPIKIIVKDTQSDTNRAAQVTGDLITNDGCDIIMAASTADTVPPVADQCEAMQVPCVTNDCPWQAYFFGRGGDPAVGFEWTYHSWWGLEGITATFVDMWDSLKTNKKVAEMWPNDGDGLAWANEKTGQPPVLRRAATPSSTAGATRTSPTTTPRRSASSSRPTRRSSAASCFPRLHQLLEAVAAAGLQPDHRHRGQGPALPAVARGARRHRLQPLQRVLVVAEPPVHVLADRPDLQGARRPVRDRQRRPVDAADPPLRHLRGRRRRAEAHHQRRRQGHHPRRHRRHRHADHRRPASRGAAATRRSTRCPTSAPRRSRAASGSRATSTRTTSSWSTTRRPPRSRPRASCSPSPTERPDTATVSLRREHGRRPGAAGRRRRPSRVRASQALPLRGVGGTRLPPEGGCPFASRTHPVLPRPRRPLPGAPAPLRPPIV